MPKLVLIEGSDDADELIPFGKAAIRREGTDVTAVAIGLMVSRTFEAAEAGAATTGKQEDLLARLQRPRELLDPASRRWIDPQAAWQRTLGNALFRVAKLVMTRGFGLTVQGVECLPRTGPLLFVPNHLSLLDPLALLAALPPSLLRST